MKPKRLTRRRIMEVTRRVRLARNGSGLIDRDKGAVTSDTQEAILENFQDMDIVWITGSRSPFVVHPE